MLKWNERETEKQYCYQKTKTIKLTQPPPPAYSSRPPAGRRLCQYIQSSRPLPPWSILHSLSYILSSSKPILPYNSYLRCKKYILPKQGMEQGRINQENLTPRRVKPPENQMAAAQNHHHQPPPPQKCPRCDSSNTKFCYYNNYSLSQPRYFCKACRRYWTHGGTLRNVPVGGGCRKTKRPKPSIPSSSSGEIARTQVLPSAAIPPPTTTQNLTGMVSGQGLPPVGSTGYSFYPTGGTFLSSLAAMQSLPTAANLGGAAGNGQYSANMAFLQNLSSAQQFQAQNEIFQLNNNIPARPLGSWTQSFISRGGGGGGSASSSAANPSFWSRADNQAGSSFNPNHNWPDNHNPGMQ